MLTPEAVEFICAKIRSEKGENVEALEIHAIMGQEPGSGRWYILGTWSPITGTALFISSQKEGVENYWKTLAPEYKQQKNAKIVSFREIK